MPLSDSIIAWYHKGTQQNNSKAHSQVVELNIHGESENDGARVAEKTLGWQRELKLGRVVYGTATGAGEIRDLEIYEKAALWGPRLPFGDFDEFQAFFNEHLTRQGTDGLELYNHM